MSRVQRASWIESAVGLVSLQREGVSHSGAGAKRASATLSPATMPKSDSRAPTLTQPTPE